MGLTMAQVIALLGPQIPVLHWVLAIVGAMLLGAIWGGIVGFLKARYEVSEVVATIMLNYVALYLSRIIIMAIPGTNTYKTVNYVLPDSIKKMNNDVRLQRARSEKEDIKKKRINIRKLRRKGLHPKYITMFLKLLEYIAEL